VDERVAGVVAVGLAFAAIAAAMAVDSFQFWFTPMWQRFLLLRVSLFHSPPFYLFLSLSSASVSNRNNNLNNGMLYGCYDSFTRVLLLHKCQTHASIHPCML
jgi:hypothetical protein